MTEYLLSVALDAPAEVDELLGDIRAEDPAVRQAALAAVGPLTGPGASPRVAGAIAEALADADATCRELAAVALAAAGSPACGILPRLVAAFGDPEPSVRRAAAAAIGQTGRGDSSAITGLVAGLADADAEVRENCATALADVVGAEKDGGQSVSPANWETAGAVLGQVARDTDAAVRRTAVRALVAFVECGKVPGGIGEVAARALDDPDPDVRAEGLRLMTAAGLPAAESLPRLSALLADPDAGVRRLAARAMGRLGADAAPAAPALHTALADNDPRVARAAAEALALVAFDRRPWLQYLLQIREFAGSARPELGARAMQLLEAPVEAVAGWLDELVDDEDEGIRWNAGLGLWRCGTGAGVARAALSRMLTDHSSALRVAAVVGLLGAGPAAGADSARVLALRLKDDELWVRQLAAAALGAIGRSAEVALPALTAATGDEREEVRNAAADAIRAITAVVNGAPSPITARVLPSPCETTIIPSWAHRRSITHHLSRRTPVCSRCSARGTGRRSRRWSASRRRACSPSPGGSWPTRRMRRTPCRMRSSAFRGLARFDGQCKLGTWLHAIAVRACLMKLRTRRRRPETPIEELLPQFHDDGHRVQPGPAWGSRSTRSSSGRSRATWSGGASTSFRILTVPFCSSATSKS